MSLSASILALKHSLSASDADVAVNTHSISAVTGRISTISSAGSIRPRNMIRVRLRSTVIGRARPQKARCPKKTRRAASCAVSICASEPLPNYEASTLNARIMPCPHLASCCQARVFRHVGVAIVYLTPHRAFCRTVFARLFLVIQHQLGLRHILAHDPLPSQYRVKTTVTCRRPAVVDTGCNQGVFIHIPCGLGNL